MAAKRRGDRRRLGIEAVPRQSTLSRFFGAFIFQSCERLVELHAWTLRSLPSSARPAEGSTLDLDSWALLHEDGHQEGVAVGLYPERFKPCHRPLVAALAQPKMAAGYAMRSRNTAGVNGAAEFLRQTVRVGLVRGDSGFGDASVLAAAEALGLKFIFVARLTRPVQQLCRHDDTCWQPTEVPGLDVQEVAAEGPGDRLIFVRQCMADRPHAGGKLLFDVPGYRFQVLRTNLLRSTDALDVWRRYNGRADIENRIKELGAQFGIKALCCHGFWATEALHHLAITAYNLCVPLQRRLGQLERCELATLRWRLFARAAVRDPASRHSWQQIFEKLTVPPTVMQLPPSPHDLSGLTRFRAPTASFRFRCAVKVSQFKSE